MDTAREVCRSAADQLPAPDGMLFDEMPFPLFLLDCHAAFGELRATTGSSNAAECPDMVLPALELERVLSTITIQRANHAASRIFAFDNSALPRPGLAGILCSQSHHAFFGLVHALAVGLGDRNDTMYFRTADGGEHPSLAQLSLFGTQDKGTCNVLLSMTGNGQRHRMLDRIADIARFPEENPAPVLRLDHEGMLLYANPAAEPALAAWRRTDPFSPVPSPLLAECRLALKSNIVATVAVRASQRVYSFVLVPVPERKYLNLYGRDITDQTKMQNALIESESNYRRLFEANPQPLFVYDTETLKFLAANSATELQYGYTRDALMDMTFLEFHLPVDRARVRDMVHSGAAVGHQGGIWKHRRKDGGTFFVELFTHAIPYGGRSARLVHAYDVTDRVHAEELARETIGFLRSVVEVGQEPSVMVDAEGMIQAVSPAIASLLGMEGEELIGTSCMSFVLREDFLLLQQSLLRIRQDPRSPQSVIIRLTRADGSKVWTEIIAKGLKVHDVIRGYVLTIKAVDILGG